MSDAGGKPSLGDVVSAAGSAVALVTAWLYVAGWSYAYHYFDRFRIPLLMVELPKEHLFVYGGLVVWKNLPAAALLSALLVGLAWAGARWSAVLGRFVLSALVVLVVAGLFALARAGGVQTARADFLGQRGSDYDAYPRVAVTLKREAAEAIGNRLADVAASDCGRLLLVSNGRLFLIRPVRGAPGTELDSFIVPLDQVQAIRIRAEYVSCG